MPRGKSDKPRLVPVDSIPKQTRRSIYASLVDEFAKSDMKTAKVEGAKAPAAISIKKAVGNLGLKNISVITAQGEVYLSKK